MLVFDTIPVDYIIRVEFDDRAAAKKYRDCIPDEIDWVVNYRLFAPGLDYEKWK